MYVRWYRCSRPIIVLPLPIHVRCLLDEFANIKAPDMQRMIAVFRNLSQNVMMPIAGVVLAFIMTLELIQLVMAKNNMHEFDMRAPFG